jgi:two-component system sensor kinase FixL
MAESLDRKQKNLEAIFDAAPVGMLLADENMIVTRVNDTVRQMLHRDYPQIVDYQIGVALGCVNSAGSQQACGYSPACPECLLRNTVKSVLDSGLSVHNVEVHPTINLDDKEVSLWFRISAEPVMIDNHRHVAVAVEDITEYKKAEHERRLVEEKYRTIFENSAVAIMVADERERLISWNKFTEELLGLDEEDLFLRPVQSLYPSAEWEKIRAYDIRQKGMQHHLETRMLRKDGSLIDIDISLSILRNSEGQTTGSIGVIRDIIERKKAELQQSRLLKQVENINQELKDFASIVSHDLKAPLRAIKTLANWISTDYADKLDQDGIEQFNLLSSKVDWMYQLIEGVLEYSRVGRVKEEQVRVNLNELVPKIIEMVSPPENIAVTVENELPTIKCEQTRITQVFQNLLSNAIKYMDKPNGRVKIGCVEEDGFWKFSIVDNGPGIEEKYFDKIFRIFQTLSPRDKSESTGVGLSIIKKIVELYGGRIWVESEVGEGTTFFFTLPMQQMGAEEAQLEASIAC